MKEIDARGLSCPAPVLQTKAAVEQENANAVKVIVDNEAAQQNVGRFLESQGFETSLERKWVRICGVWYW
jgi:TusA-related sulfurtransferase